MRFFCNRWWHHSQVRASYVMKNKLSRTTANAICISAFWCKMLDGHGSQPQQTLIPGTGRQREDAFVTAWPPAQRRTSPPTLWHRQRSTGQRARPKSCGCIPGRFDFAMHELLVARAVVTWQRSGRRASQVRPGHFAMGGASFGLPLAGGLFLCTQGGNGRLLDLVRGRRLGRSGLEEFGDFVQGWELGENRLAGVARLRCHLRCFHCFGSEFLCKTTRCVVKIKTNSNDANTNWNDANVNLNDANANLNDANVHFNDRLQYFHWRYSSVLLTLQKSWQMTFKVFNILTNTHKQY